MGTTSSSNAGVVSNLMLIMAQAFTKLQMELMREGMTVEMGSPDPDTKNR